MRGTCFRHQKFMPPFHKQNRITPRNRSIKYPGRGNPCVQTCTHFYRSRRRRSGHPCRHIESERLAPARGVLLRVCERFSHAKQQNFHQHTPARLTGSRTRPWTSDPFATEPSGTATLACAPRLRRRRQCRQTATRHLWPAREHRGVQSAPAGEVRPVFRPALGNVVLDRFHEVVPQCPGLAVDLGHRFDVHVSTFRMRAWVVGTGMLATLQPTDGEP